MVEHIPECDGNGHIPCWECHGVGFFEYESDDFESEPCGCCGGSGVVATAKCCPGCRAEGAC